MYLSCLTNNNGKRELFVEEELKQSFGDIIAFVTETESEISNSNGNKVQLGENAVVLPSLSCHNQFFYDYHIIFRVS